MQYQVWIRVWCPGRLVKGHSGFHRCPPCFPQIAAAAGGNHILPSVAAVLATGYHVVQSQVLGLLAAILAGEPVSQEHLFLGQLPGQERPFDHVDQPDDGGGLDYRSDGVELSLVVLKRLGFAFVEHHHGPADRANVHRNVVEVQHQDRSADQHSRVHRSWQIRQPVWLLAG